MVAKTNFFLNFFENSRKFFLVPVTGLVQHALNCFHNFLCQYNAIVVGLIPTWGKEGWVLVKELSASRMKASSSF